MIKCQKFQKMILQMEVKKKNKTGNANSKRDSAIRSIKSIRKKHLNQ